MAENSIFSNSNNQTYGIPPSARLSNTIGGDEKFTSISSSQYQRHGKQTQSTWAASKKSSKSIVDQTKRITDNLNKKKFQTNADEAAEQSR